MKLQTEFPVAVCPIQHTSHLKPLPNLLFGRSTQNTVEEAAYETKYKHVRETNTLFSCLLFLHVIPAPRSLITAASCYTTSVIHVNNKKIIIIITPGDFCEV